MWGGNNKKLYLLTDCEFRLKSISLQSQNSKR